MKRKVLSEKQIEEFIERGWTRLECAFAPADALVVQDFLWQQLRKQGIQKSDATTWVNPMVHLQKTYDGPQFQVCNTENLLRNKGLS